MNLDQSRRRGLSPRHWELLLLVLSAATIVALIGLALVTMLRT